MKSLILIMMTCVLSQLVFADDTLMSISAKNSETAQQEVQLALNKIGCDGADTVKCVPAPSMAKNFHCSFESIKCSMKSYEDCSSENSQSHQLMAAANPAPFSLYNASINICEKK